MNTKEVFAELQKATDQLLAMYLKEHPTVLPSQLPVLTLIQWAYQQSQQEQSS